MTSTHAHASSLALAIACGLFTAGERLRVPLLGFFNEDQLQLIFPSEHSRALCARAYPRTYSLYPRVSDAARGVVVVEQGGWHVSRFYGVRDELVTPKDHVCVGFIDEEGRGDVVRCRFEVEGFTVEQAFAENMEAITVSPVLAEGAALAVAQRVADRLFESHFDIVLESVGREDDVEFGVTGYKKPEVSEGYVDMASGLDWREVLKWWKRGNEVGFVVPRQMWVGGFTITHDPVLTRNWFFPRSESE